MKFGEVIAKFLARCEERGLENATIKCYRYCADKFLIPTLGDRDIRTLKPRDFDALAQALTELGYVPSTIQKAVIVAGGALKFAQRQEWVDVNVARLAELPKLKEPKRNIPLPEQLATFLAGCEDQTMHDFTWIMAHTGMRPGEACALRTDDLAADNTLTIQRSVDVSCAPPRLKGTKTGRVRRIVVDERTAAIIRSRPGPFVIGGDKPARTDLMAKRWKRIAEKLGLAFTPRSCRHFHATQLVVAGHRPKDVADRLGHTTDQITQRVYIQYIAARDSALAESIAGVFEEVA